MTIRPVPKPKPRPKKSWTPLQRSRTPIARGPVKRVNRKRKASAFERAYHSKERVAFVKSRPCFVANGQCCGGIENAHVTKDGSEGIGRKSGYRCIAPLCHSHHRELHQIGPAFEPEYGVSLVFAAAQTQLAWEQSNDFRAATQERNHR